VAAVKYDIDSLDNRDPDYVMRAVEVLEPQLNRWFDPHVYGMHRIPEGPALYVGNHNGGLLAPDIFIMGAAIARERGVDDLPYGLAHEFPLKWPGAGGFLLRLGAVRASHENARKILDRGRKILVYPGGDIDSMRPSRARNRVVFGHRRGYIRLALRERIPVSPVVTAGAHSGWLVLSDGRRLAHLLGVDRTLRIKVFPLTISIPWGVTLGPPPPYVPVPTRVLQEFLDPIRFDREGPEAADDEEFVEACHKLVHHRVQRALVRLAARRRELGRWPHS
jgi:1-acyl-sn-glycerol-3-phosphate acyltransferase